MVGLAGDVAAVFLIAANPDEVPTAWHLAHHGNGRGEADWILEWQNIGHLPDLDRLCLHRDEYVQQDGVVRLLETFNVEAFMQQGHLPSS